jgi:erythromycin esterase-like protein
MNIDTLPDLSLDVLAAVVRKAARPLPGAAAARKRVRPALPGSYEALFHDAGPGRFLLALRSGRVPGLDQPRLERAIGVIYRPDTERASHYLRASLPAQSDAVLHFDRTRAVEPLERIAAWHDTEVPETFPSGV